MLKKIFRSKIFRYSVLTIFLLFLVCSSVIGYYLYKIVKDLPPVEEIVNYRFNQPSILYDVNGVVIAELGDQTRYPVPFSDIPSYLVHAVVATEDSRFYEHSGVDLIGIMRAVVVNLKSGRLSEGGSTLTQQLVKNIFLTPEKKFKRKFKEAVLAYQIDKLLSKDEIIEFYLNYIYFGRGAYGVQAAAINYFGKNAKDLTLAESALLAGLPKAPSSYAPHVNKERALSRRNHVLSRMLELNYITEDEYFKTLDEPVVIIESIPPRLKHAGYFMDYVIKYLSDELDIKSPQSKGLKIYTTLDIDFQLKAEKAVQTKLIENSKRIGYFGPVEKKSASVESNVLIADEDDNVSVAPTFESLMQVKGYLSAIGFRKALVTEVSDQKAKIEFLDQSKGVLYLKDNRWAKPAYSNKNLTDLRTILKADDIIYVIHKENAPVEEDGAKVYFLEQDPPMQSSLLAIDPKSGAIKAMVGGFSFEKSMFNRATQAKRQVGSIFKPFVYIAAIESGYQPMSKILDAPYITQPDDNGIVWRPKNVGDKYYGETTLKEGVIRSRNVITIKLAEKVGIRKVIDYARKFGITSDLPRDLSITIGSGSISLIEMVYAYSVFPNLGTKVDKPYFVTKVEDSEGAILFESNSPDHVQVIKPNTAQIMTDIFVNVVENGTGFRAKVIPRPIGVKTGTSNDNKDAWYLGFLPNLVVGVWVGFDDQGDVGMGSQAAGPIWVDFVNSVVKSLPYEVFPVSDGVIYRKIDIETWEPAENMIHENISFEPYYVEVEDGQQNADNKTVDEQ